LLIVGRAILGRRERRGDRDESGRDKNEQAVFEHGDLLFKTDLSTAKNGIMSRKLLKKIGFGKSLHNFTKRSFNL
jgi:hypothetical protein